MCHAHTYHDGQNDRMHYRGKERKNMYLVYQKSQARTQGVRISGILHGGATLLKIPMLGPK